MNNQHDNSYKYFENRACKYYPCHKGSEHLNCLFCFCPLYNLETCPGNKEWISVEGKRIKDCSKCTFPHQEKNYDEVLKLLGTQ